MQRLDHGKKLSWVYRNKKRISRNQRSDQPIEDAANVQIQNRKARIVLRNLPFKVTEEDIRTHYAPYGEIEEINLLRHPGGKLVGCGFVQFKKVEQASKAIFNTNKKELLGRVITSDWAIPKYKFSETVENKKDESNETEDLQSTENISKDPTLNDATNSLSKTQLKKELKKKRREKEKLKNTQKRARLIVRNLSFNITDEILKEHFSPFGNVEEVKILTRPDGKLVGCGFVQFSLVQSAAKAIHNLNLKPLLGRPAIVDWAVPKTKFGQLDKEKTASEDDKEQIEIKEEVPDELNNRDEEIKEEISSVKSEEDCPDDEESDKEKSSDENDEIASNDEDIDEKDVNMSPNEIKDEEARTDEKSRPRVISNDVTEGKTVFLKNVPFSATNDDLRQCMEQFGPVYYALICMDSMTEHSKGTAFVKFQHLEDAEKCLSAGTELRLHDQVLDPHKALDRNEIQNKSELKKQKATDSRNLYLVKEGVILAGSPAAVGVSASDMAHRLQLEQWKSQMLRNLNMFISRVRLVVHNLPITVDDKRLRDIFQNHSGPKAVIREARVMRDLRNIESNGLGKSKEYGFVAFTSHEDALKALRNINNNPKIFGPTKRPIVAFSIENRVMVNAIKKRIEKSRERNPLWNGKEQTNTRDRVWTNKRKFADGESGDDKKSKLRRKPVGNKRIKRDQLSATNPPVENATGNEDIQSYAGVTSKAGERKMRSRFNLKSQAVLHKQTLRKELKNKKSKAKIQLQKKEARISRNEIRPKQGAQKKSREDVDFNKLVNNYKTKMMAAPQAKSKWYET
ncbi:RNA-binding protein 28 [Athalia rosae]|uniref:RNA-binding protein 28 n=1 Tax=Athalia rosae TaxID=37344 RepID=UPI0020334AB6|nr:RNA-binding protein 28 [Athalia rosae]